MHARTIPALALLAWASPAWAEGAPAIQELRFRPGHELTLGVGLLPLDAYTKGVTGALGYLVHLDDHLAWRVAEVAYASPYASDLRRDLELSYGVPESRFARSTLLATSELVLQLLYGRESLLNRAALWSATSVSLGAGGVMVREDEEDTPYPAAVVGLGYKLFVDETWALRLEARGLLVVESLGWPEPIVWLSMAASYAVSER